MSRTDMPIGEEKFSKLKLTFLIFTLTPGSSLIILLSISFCKPSKLNIIEDVCQIRRKIIMDIAAIADARILKIGKLKFFTKKTKFL